MIEVKGNFAQGREMMKTKRAKAQKEIKRLEKKMSLTKEEDELLQGHRDEIPVYSLSRNLPARYENLIINSKVLVSFMKKLKNMKTEIRTEEGMLTVSYKNQDGSQTGLLELYDQSPYFKGFNDIPEMEIKQ